MNMIFNRKIVLILCIALLFRLCIIFVLPVRKFENSIQRYHDTAVNLIEGRGYSHFHSPPYYPTFLKPPVYSFFLATIYKVFGINITIAKIIQAMLDSLACFLLFLLTRNYFSLGAAFTVMFLAAICPITAVYTNLLNPESLTLFFMALSLLFISRSLINNTVLDYFLAGLSVILMGYSRPEFFIFVFIFAGVIFFIKKGRKLKLYLFYSLGVIVIMAPWVARNYWLTGKVIPLSTGGVAGAALYWGTLGEEANSQDNFKKFLKYNPEVEQLQAQIHKYAVGNENNALDLEKASELGRILKKMAIERILRNPGSYLMNRLKSIPRVWMSLHADEYVFLNTRKLRLMHPDFRKILQFAKEDPREIRILIAKYALFTINILYLLAALIGIWAISDRIFQFAFIIIPLICAQLLFLLIHISACYTVPYWPCIIFFSGIGFYRVLFRKQGLDKTYD